MAPDTPLFRTSFASASCAAERTAPPTAPPATVAAPRGAPMVARAVVARVAAPVVMAASSVPGGTHKSRDMRCCLDMQPSVNNSYLPELFSTGSNTTSALPSLSLARRLNNREYDRPCMRDVIAVRREPATDFIASLCARSGPAIFTSAKEPLTGCRLQLCQQEGCVSTACLAAYSLSEDACQSCVWIHPSAQLQLQERGEETAIGEPGYL